MQISFGAKIPISTCSIYNKEAQKYERATLYEIDCIDEDDIDYLSDVSSKESWEFKDSIVYDARSKYLDLKYYMYPKDIMNKYYSLEAKNGEIACLCETQPLLGDINIRYIESNPDKKYRYSGLTMLASIANLLYGTEQNLEVKTPCFEARGFYSKGCGFKEDLSGFGFELPQKDVENFIKKTEERTKGKIFSIQG